MAGKTTGQSILEGVAGFLVGYAIGEMANDTYHRLTPQQKVEYEKSRVAHHGEIGLPVLAQGASSKSAGAAGLGAGLIASDWNDRDRWLK